MILPRNETTIGPVLPGLTSGGSPRGGWKAFVELANIICRLFNSNIIKSITIILINQGISQVC